MQSSTYLDNTISLDMNGQTVCDFHEFFPSFYDDVDDPDFHSSLTTIATTTSCYLDEDFDIVLQSNRVSFATTVTTVHIPVELGDHPACPDGPPIQLVSSDNDDKAHVTFDPIRFAYDNIDTADDCVFWPAQERYEMLLEAGYTVEQLQKAMNAASFISDSREESLLASMGLCPQQEQQEQSEHLPLSKTERVWINRILFQDDGEAQDEEEEEEEKEIKYEQGEKGYEQEDKADYKVEEANNLCLCTPCEAFCDTIGSYNSTTSCESSISYDGESSDSRFDRTDGECKDISKCPLRELPSKKRETTSSAVPLPGLLSPRQSVMARCA